MQHFSLETHIGADGILHLNLPVLVKNADLKVTVVCKPVAKLPPEQASVWQALQAFRASANF
jgi:hypothetical protein